MSTVLNEMRHTPKIGWVISLVVLAIIVILISIS